MTKKLFCFILTIIGITLCIVFLVLLNVKNTHFETEIAVQVQEKIPEIIHSPLDSIVAEHVESLDGIQIKANQTDSICLHHTSEVTTTRKHSIIEYWALIIAVLSLALTIPSTIYQIKTEINTSVIDQNVQRGILIDLIRHLYRNFEVCVVMYIEMEKNKKKDNYTMYPAEEHLSKLKVPLENIHFEAFNNEKYETYAHINELYLNLRNYNEEIDAIYPRLSDKNMDYKIKFGDFEILFTRIESEVERICKIATQVWETPPKYLPNFIYRCKKGAFKADCQKKIQEALNKDSDKYNKDNHTNQKEEFKNDFQTFFKNHKHLAEKQWYCKSYVNLFTHKDQNQDAIYKWFTECLEISAYCRAYLLQAGQKIRLIPFPKEAISK